MYEVPSLVGRFFTQQPDQLGFTKLDEIPQTLHLGHDVLDLMTRYTRYSPEHSYRQIILNTGPQSIGFGCGGAFQDGSDFVRFVMVQF